jgi:gentisate 1,2-dioxygenase
VTSTRSSSAESPARRWPRSRQPTFPGNGPPPHTHHREDETLFILEGTYSVRLGERELHAAPGSFVHIPRGTPHTYRNLGSHPARMLVTLTPAGFERFWQEIGEPATQRATPPAIDTAAVLARLKPQGEST